MIIRRFISIILKSQTWKVISIIGGLGGLKYGTDIVVDGVYNHRKLMQRNENVARIIITDKDREYFKGLKSDDEVKDLKYESKLKSKEQEILKQKGKLDEFYNDNVRIDE